MAAFAFKLHFLRSLKLALIVLNIFFEFQVSLTGTSNHVMANPESVTPAVTVDILPTKSNDAGLLDRRPLPSEVYCFVFSTGRCASKHMSQLFVSRRGSHLTYITHQEEHASMSTRQYVDRYYRALAAHSNQKELDYSARVFVRTKKIPFFRKLLAAHNATRLLYTGHLPLVFGLGPYLADEIAPAKLKILRMRRNRLTSALSLMALGPEEEDPWSDEFVADAPPSLRRRWFPTPRSRVTRLHVTPENFTKMNRFQRWLWYVDDVECRWQALLRTKGHQFEWIEESLEGLSIMDGGRGWKRIADFLEVDINTSRLYKPDNTIEDKGRVKLDVSERVLLDWDARYRELVGQCDLFGDGSLRYSWTLPVQEVPTRCHGKVDVPLVVRDGRIHLATPGGAMLHTDNPKSTDMCPRDPRIVLNGPKEGLFPQNIQQCRTRH